MPVNLVSYVNTGILFSGIALLCHVLGVGTVMLLGICSTSTILQEIAAGWWAGGRARDMTGGGIHSPDMMPNR